MKVKRAILLLLAAVMAFACAACGGHERPPGPEPGGDLPDIPDIEEYRPFDLSRTVNLNMALMYDKDSYITYNQDASDPNNNMGYLGANNKRYTRGKVKPVWEALSENLNFTVTDKSYAGSFNDLTTQWTMLQAQSFSGVDMMNARGEYIIEEAVTNKRFVDISKYFENMPNLHRFLKANPLIYKQIQSGDGGMYYSPYFDGYDDLERMFMMRADWVEKLLDGPVSPSFDTHIAMSGTHYQKFMPASLNKKFTVVNAAGTETQEITKNYSQNIIDIQNALGNKNGAALTQALRSYIDSAYGSFYGDKRSALFCGVNAAYDPDELVALLRCVKTNPRFLRYNENNVGSGVVGDRDDIVPFYPRAATADRTMDIFRLAEIWGVRGMEGRSDWFYIDDAGILQDARIMDNTMAGLERLHQLYEEGLILDDYAANENNATFGLPSFTGDDSHRGRLNVSNLGFMTYDYNQTTTLLNKLGDKAGSDPIDWGDKGRYIEGFSLVPVLPPFTNWDSGNAVPPAEVEYTRFTDSWRSVKADGWGVLASASTEKRERALALMDYMFSPEGAKLMSYGPDAWIDGEIEYMGKKIPKLSDKALAELAHYGNGNYTNYYRRFLGGTFPIGYIKEQGMEYQTVHPKGQKGLNNILKAVELGTVSHLEVSDPASVDPVMRSLPSSWAYTQQIAAMIRDNTPLLTQAFPVLNYELILFTDYVYYGFDNTDAGHRTLTRQGLTDLLNSNGYGVTLQLTYARAAYDKLK
jgi:putative aldouronate transport system substrate-binding protein